MCLAAAFPPLGYWRGFVWAPWAQLTYWALENPRYSHLPLVVPENCGQLRVGNESRTWREGELLIFDDSIEHEAWNHSEHDRIVLIFEVWRPELTAEERNAICDLLRVIRQYATGKG